MTMMLRSRSPPQGESKDRKGEETPKLASVPPVVSPSPVVMNYKRNDEDITTQPSVTTNNNDAMTSPTLTKKSEATAKATNNVAVAVTPAAVATPATRKQDAAKLDKNKMTPLVLLAKSNNNGKKKGLLHGGKKKLASRLAKLSSSKVIPKRKTTTRKKMTPGGGRGKKMVVLPLLVLGATLSSVHVAKKFQTSVKTSSPNIIQQSVATTHRNVKSPHQEPVLVGSFNETKINWLGKTKTVTTEGAPTPQKKTLRRQANLQRASSSNKKRKHPRAVIGETTNKLLRGAAERIIPSKDKLVKGVQQLLSDASVSQHADMRDKKALVVKEE